MLFCYLPSQQKKILGPAKHSVVMTLLSPLTWKSTAVFVFYDIDIFEEHKPVTYFVECPSIWDPPVFKSNKTCHNVAFHSSCGPFSPCFFRKFSEEFETTDCLYLLTFIVSLVADNSCCGNIPNTVILQPFINWPPPLSLH